jgi:hypothetical protein
MKPSLFDEVAAIDAQCRAQGISLPQVIAWAARAGFGVEANLRTPPQAGIVDASSGGADPALILSMVEHMGKLQDAIDDLNAEVADSRGKLASIEAHVRGFPAVVAAAVAEALAAVPGLDEAAAAASIDAARSAISDSVDTTLAAIFANPVNDNEPGAAETPAADVPGEGAFADAVTPATDAAPATDTATEATTATDTAPATEPNPHFPDGQ